MFSPIRIASRASRLALWQANHIAELIRPYVGDRSVEIIEVGTTGDVVTDRPLASIGGEGVFTKEIQRAVLENRADIAVHSLKDLPTDPAPGLRLAAVPKRGPTADVFISKEFTSIDSLPTGATIATGSPRRVAQLLKRRPDVTTTDIRGNIETRISKLDDPKLDGLILAEAGLVRLGLDYHISERLVAPDWLPAVGQGALGLECRDDDQETADLLAQINHRDSMTCTLAERAFLRELAGGCSQPIGALATHEDEKLSLLGGAFQPTGAESIVQYRAGIVSAPESLGIELARVLLKSGLREFL